MAVTRLCRLERAGETATVTQGTVAMPWELSYFKHAPRSEEDGEGRVLCSCHMCVRVCHVRCVCVCVCVYVCVRVYRVLAFRIAYVFFFLEMRVTGRRRGGSFIVFVSSFCGSSGGGGRCETGL